MYNGKTISVILPTYAERDSIRKAILDFFHTGVVDTVVVVDNNAEAGTLENTRGTGAFLVRENRQGFGYAVQAGLKINAADLIVISEPDGTFAANDILKMLSCCEKYDMVVGTRTNKKFISRGANMQFSLRLGNLLAARVISCLFRGPKLTDVGCTMRLINKEALAKIMPHFTVTGSAFNIEMTILTLKEKLKIIEIPVAYRKRIGKSSVTGRFLPCCLVALQMVMVILRHGMSLLKIDRSKNTKKDFIAIS